jgi:hypothetical protein
MSRIGKKPVELPAGVTASVLARLLKLRALKVPAAMLRPTMLQLLLKIVLFQ